jgi:hypothetical protein
LGRSTRDGKDLTVDPAAVTGSEESYHAGDILGDGAATERAVLGHEVLDLLGGPVGGTARDVVPVKSVLARVIFDIATERRKKTYQALEVNMSDLIPPGATPLTVIPRLPKSVAKALIIPITAILEAL